MIVPDNQIDVWCSSLDAIRDPALVDSYRSLLSLEEAERHSRFLREEDRNQFLLSRALVRDVLSQYVGMQPSALVFTQNEFGKPSLTSSADRPITFSLSHTRGLSVCAVALERPIGVDVESLQRTSCHPDIARRFFASSEADFLDRFDGDRKRTEFLRLWTLKEAFVKARGKGLSIPLDSFAMALSSDHPTRISFTGGEHGREADWQFLHMRVGSSFHIAVAVSSPDTRGRVVRFSRIIPLSGESSSVVLEPNLLDEWALDDV